MTAKLLKLGLLAVGLALGFNLPIAAADAYPSKPIRIVVPVPPGGSTDVTTRIVARRMSERLGQAVVVENKPGGDGAIGTQFVKNEPPDGYTILADSNAFALFPALKRNPGYDPAKDFAPLGPMVRAPLVLVVSASQTDRTLMDLISRAKQNRLEYASSATSVRLPTEMFLQAAGISMLHVPYKGSATAYPDVAAGRVAMMLTGYPGLDSFLKSGRMRALAVTSPNRIAPLPDVPTLVEQGINFTTHYWIGMMLRAGTPSDVVAKLSDALRYALTDKELVARITGDGGDPSYMSPEAFGQLIAKDAADALKVSSDLKLPKD